MKKAIKHRLSGSFYSLFTIHSSLLGKAKRWLKYHGRKLATASLAVVLAVAMVVGLQLPASTTAVEMLKTEV